MINAWSLLYEELNGTMAKTYPIKDDDMSPCKLDDINITTGNDPITTVGSGNTATAVDSSTDYWVDTTQMGDIKIDTSVLDNDRITISGGDTVVNFEDFKDQIVFADTEEYETLNIDTSGYPSAFTALSDNDDAIAHLIDKPISSGIEDNSIRKYKEDEAIKALQDYISTTYGGHYTSKENNVQTLDLIESVGDAESFCRSNAIKYLSRYDKKGRPQHDILKAIHYCVLLYHFTSKPTDTETSTPYETF